MRITWTITIALLFAAWAHTQSVPPAPVKKSVDSKSPAAKKSSEAKRVLQAPAQVSGSSTSKASAPEGAAKPPKETTTDYTLGVKLPPAGMTRIPAHDNFTLGSGLRVYFGADGELPLVQGKLYLRAGRLYGANPALSEMAALTMRSGGVRGMTGPQFEEKLSELGATLSIDLSATIATISFRAPSAGAEALYDLLGRMLTEPAFSVDSIEQAQARLHDAVEARNNAPLEVSARLARQVLFDPASHYSRQLENEGIDSIGREEIRAFVNQYYVPANALLVVYGNQRTAEARQKLESAFGGWKSPAPVAADLPSLSKPPAATIVTSTLRRLEKGTFAIAFRAGKLSSRETAALNVAAEMFGGSLDTVDRMRRDTMSISLQAELMRSAEIEPVFQVVGSARSSAVNHAIQMSFREFTHLGAGDFTDAQLIAARDSLSRSISARLNRPAAILADAALSALHSLPENSSVTLQQDVQAVTKAEVSRAVQRVLQPSAAVIVVLGESADQLQPLADLGMPIRQMDISIPAAKPVEARSDAASIQQAGEWLGKLRTALGGDTRIAALKDFRAELTGTVNTPGGAVPAQYIEIWVKPGTYRQEQYLPNQTITGFYNGKIGWLGSAGSVAPLPPYLVRQLDGALFRMPWMLALSDKDPARQISYMGSGILQIQDNTGNSARIFLDEETGRIEKLRYQLPLPNGSTALMEDRFSDWREAGGGIRLPARIVTWQNNQPVRDLTVELFQVNTNLTLQEVEKKP